MIYSLRGELILKDNSLAVIECGGVGYACRTTNYTLSQIGTTGSQVKLLTYLYVREDNVELFGFATSQELDCFKLLMTVSGVGPKAGLAILSDTSPERFILSIASGDSKAFQRTKGVGVKLAQRIVLELKDKVSSKDITASAFSDGSNITMDSSAISEAISALETLGYAQSEITPLIAKLDPNMSSSDIIKTVLKNIGKKF